MGTSASAIIQQVCSAGVGKAPCTTVNAASFTAFLTLAAQTRFLPPYTTSSGASSPSACTGLPSAPNALQNADQLASIGLGVGLKGASEIATSLGSAAASAIPIVGIIAQTATQIIGIIAAKHAAAVKNQDFILCQSVPATNNLLSQIDNALANGSLTVAQTASAYQSFLAQFTAAVKSDPSYKAGDALNGYVVALQVVIAQRMADLNAGMLTNGASIPYGSVTEESIAAANPSFVAPPATASGATGFQVAIGSFAVPGWALMIFAALILFLFIGGD